MVEGVAPCSAFLSRFEALPDTSRRWRAWLAALSGILPARLL